MVRFDKQKSLIAFAVGFMMVAVNAIPLIIRDADGFWATLWMTAQYVLGAVVIGAIGAALGGCLFAYKDVQLRLRRPRKR